MLRFPVAVFFALCCCLLFDNAIVHAQGPCYCHSGQFRQPSRGGFNLQFGHYPRYRFMSDDGYDGYGFAPQQMPYAGPNLQGLEFRGYILPQRQFAPPYGYPGVRDYEGFSYPQYGPPIYQGGQQLIRSGPAGCSTGNCRR